MVENPRPDAIVVPVAPTPHRKDHPRRQRWLWVAVVIVAVGAGAYLAWPTVTGLTKKSDSGKRAARGPAIILVTAVRARKGDMPVYINGLGSVTPLATVTVKSRVDGELTKVRYREGDTVAAGDVLMEIDPRPYQVQLTQAEGQLARDQATLDNARIDLSRYQTLLRQNAIPEQQVATQRSTVAQNEGVVKTDQGQVDAAKLNLIYTRITSPITGRIGLRLVDAGNIVHASDANGLVVITQMDPTSVLFTIPQDQLPVVMQKMRYGALAVDAFDRDMKVKLATGRLSTVDNQIDQSTGTIRLRATFSNRGNNLFPNQFVNARLLQEMKRGVVIIPEAAVQRSASSMFVYVVQSNSTVALRKIQVGTTEAGNVEVSSGLQAGDVVVMSGADKLDEGSKVNAQIAGEQSNNNAPAKTHSGKRS
jgi:multidrug efflux system membrane fusion protein